MNRSSAGKWARRAVWGTLLAVATIGCNPLNIAGFIFARDEKVPAPHPLTFAKDGPKKDKEEVVVLVLAQVAHGGNPQFATVDRDLAGKLARQLPEQAKENNKDKKLKIKVISPTQVDKFKMANPKWKTMPPGEIGKNLNADYVLEIYLEKMRLFQPNTQNAIYEGRAEVSVSIYEVGAEGGDFKDRYEMPFAYPKTGVRDAAAIPESEFKKLFLENLTSEIIRHHVDSRPSTGIAE